MFGTSLTLGEAISISDQKLAVFSWQGAKILVQGEPEIAYTSDDTPMQSYTNVHDTLEARRRAASERAAAAAAGLATEGPRVMLVGPTDAGKSSLSKILLNYAVRCGWTPTFVDLDLGEEGGGRWGLFWIARGGSQYLVKHAPTSHRHPTNRPGEHHHPGVHRRDAGGGPAGH